MFYFHVFIEEEDYPSDKVVIIEKERYGIGKLVNLPRLMFINKNVAIFK